MPVCGSTGPLEAENGQVANIGPNSSRKTAWTTWSSVDRMPTSASPPAPLVGPAATMAGSTAGRIPVRMPPSEMPKAKRSAPGFTAPFSKRCVLLSSEKTALGKTGNPAMSGMPSALKSPALVTTLPVSCTPVPSKLRSRRTSCIQSTIDCRTTSRV